MAFNYQAVKEQFYPSWIELKKAVKKEENGIIRISVYGFVKQGARFFDDKYFGEKNDTAFKFNLPGFRSFCSLIGIRLDSLEMLSRQNLVSDILNDLITQQAIQDKLHNRELIVNEENNEIIGVVSPTYVGYSNLQLIQNIEELFYTPSLFPDKEKFIFQTGYSINTQLSLRFTMRNEMGVIKGKGGSGDDETNLGFQFRNSMVGDSSININFFLHRKICANGLIVPAGSVVNRIFHSGKKVSFEQRVKKAFDSITERIGQSGKMVEQLGSLEFRPDLLARMNCSKMIFDVIKCSKGEILNNFKIPGMPRKGNKKENIILREAAIINHIPDLFGREYSKRVFNSSYRDNASMFDFINIFTEYAKELMPKERIAVEERTGVLAAWLAKNKKKFNRMSEINYG